MSDAIAPTPPTIGSWIDALRIITEIDFDHALTGHAQAGTKKDAADLLRYLEELASGVAAGRTLAEIQKTLTLDSYKSWEGGTRIARRTSQPSTRRSSGRAVAVPREPAPLDRRPE
jgi:hypothetical protein